MSFGEIPFRYLGVTPEAACRFFAAFSRMEYALKATNLRQKGWLAKPSWDRFAERIDGPFAAAIADPNSQLSKAVAYILAEPPQVQVQEDGRMRWGEFARKQNATDLQHLFDLVKQVRNNLFHGGKYIDSQEERDASLIRSSMIILEACVRMDAEVEGWYFDLA